VSDQSKTTLTVGFKLAHAEFETFEAMMLVRGFKNKSEYLRWLYETDLRVIQNWQSIRTKGDQT